MSRALPLAVPSAPNSNWKLAVKSAIPLAMRTCWLTLGHPKAATGHPEHATPNFCQKLCWPMLSTKLHNDALFRLDHLAAHLDRLRRAVAHLHQNPPLE